ncbi:chromatin modification-related protein eaf-1-like [Rhagoletis pomonella]|uniref:chromatin modification-related protein eaf-1-like n=1 Tax=Rhagoletis pomonella TaxID=28610 RepID=UPI001782833E|nr:chromatin modification-related protein eaf-1-like [Rhagoletis pomonella]
MTTSDEAALGFALLSISCFSIAFAENVANISDSLAVETTVDTIKVTTSLAPETKSKTGKRDSSDQIGPTTFTLKEDEPFKPITGATNHQQLQIPPQQFQSQSLTSTFQPTTVRHVAEEAAPQAYYDRPPNSDANAVRAAGKISNFVEGGIHYAPPQHGYRGPFKGPYQLQLEQTHPHPSASYQFKQRYPQQQYSQPSKTQTSPNYAGPSQAAGFAPLQGPLQQLSPPHQGQYQSRAQEEQQIEQHRQYKQNQQQQHPEHLHKYIQQQPSFFTLQRQQQPQQQQQLQYQQPSRQQIHYIIAIPLSYVRQLQHQLTSQHGSPPTPQKQHQAPVPMALQSLRAPLAPLIVLQPVGGGSSLSREPYRQQPPAHYAPQAPAPSNTETSSHIQSPLALAPQQLPVPLNLVLAVRPRQAVYPASQLLYVQPQLYRQTPQQQLQLPGKQHQQLSHYAQAPDQQQSHAVEQRNAQQPQQQPQPQQHEDRPKPTVKQVPTPPPSAATDPASSSLPLSIPSQAASPHAPTALPFHSSLAAAPPVFFYNPNYVQAPPAEQLPLPPSHYGNYIQAPIGPTQHPATLVKLSTPSALLAPQTAPPSHFYPVQHPFSGGPSSLAAVLSPQSLLVAKTPLQLQQPSHQQTPAFPAFISRPAVYMAPQDVVDSIGAPVTGGGLPYFIHPAGVHYGTHLRNPDTPLAATSNLLESVANADSDSQQHLHQHQQLRPEHHRKQQQQQPQQQQQLGSRATSGGKDDNNAIVKYP